MRTQRGLTTAALALLVGVQFCKGHDDPICPDDVRIGNCPSACHALSAILNEKVSYQNSTIYTLEEEDYWSNRQVSVTPFCRVTPATAQDASITITTVRKFKCPFAVKSGGHAAFAGASNIQGGITIDLREMKSIKVSGDKSTTEVGAGNVWNDVYNELDKLGLSVVGGRVRGVGVGGLTTGGGISFFSGRYGWACDNVRNYEVIFADGSINNVNPSTHPDLFWALRGGGNNFGLVTRFDLVTFPQGPMWGGLKTYTFDKGPELIDAFLDFGSRAPTDPDAAIVIIASHTPKQGYSFRGMMEHRKPEAEPNIFSAFKPIPTSASTMRITNLTDLVDELGLAYLNGLRQSFWTFTISASGPLFKKILAIWQSEIDPIKGSISKFSTSVVAQHFTKNFLLNSLRNYGNNALGLDPAKAPYTLMLITMEWEEESDDARVLGAAARIVSRSEQEAKKMGRADKFLYMNYAAAAQNVFPGYGEENVRKLIKVHKKYDPAGVFTVLQPGYHKLPDSA